MTTKTSLRSIARLLLLIGGIILILGSSPDRCGSPRSLGLRTASPISRHLHKRNSKRTGRDHSSGGSRTSPQPRLEHHPADLRDRKSTRLNSSHSQISYAVFCLKKKKNNS